MHIYENRTPNLVSVVFKNEAGTIIHYTFGPFSNLQLLQPALDGYIPHHLTKVCEVTGRILLGNKELAKEIEIEPEEEPEHSPEVLPKHEEEPEPEPEVIPDVPSIEIIGKAHEEPHDIDIHEDSHSDEDVVVKPKRKKKNEKAISV